MSGLSQKSEGSSTNIISFYPFTSIFDISCSFYVDINVLLILPNTIFVFKTFQVYQTMLIFSAMFWFIQNIYKLKK